MQNQKNTDSTQEKKSLDVETILKDIDPNDHDAVGRALEEAGYIVLKPRE